MENFVAIIRSSVELAIGTDSLPFSANVLLNPGIKFEGVRSRLILIDDGILRPLIFIYNAI